MTANALERYIRPRLRLVDQTGDDPAVVNFPEPLIRARPATAEDFYDRLYGPRPSYYPIGRQGLSLDQIGLGIAAIAVASVIAFVKIRSRRSRKSIL